MGKELNILQAIEMPVGTEFKILNAEKDDKNSAYSKTATVSVSECNSKILLGDGEDEFGFNDYIASLKFEVIQKPVSFEEAICSNKRIKVVVPKELNYKYRNGITCLLNDNWNNKYKTVNNILKMLVEHEKKEVLIKKCKWYIEEE